MDDELVERWRRGDAAAATALRNAVRTIAERMLSHPSLGRSLSPEWRERLGDEDQRREITARIAMHVLRQPVGDAAALTAAAVMASGRLAVEALREGRLVGGTAHLPPPVAVSMALAPEGVATVIRQAAERHLAECAACAEDIRVVRTITRAQSVVDRGASPAAIAREIQRSDAIETPDPAVAHEMVPLEETTEEAPRKPAPPRRSPARPPVSDRRIAALDDKPMPSGARHRWLGLIPILVITAVLIWYGRTRRTAGQPVDPEVALLADRSVPPAPSAGSLPADARAGIIDLERDDCRSAGAHFRTARRDHPEVARLYLLEGASFVCAGDGRRAIEAFDALSAMGANRDSAGLAHLDWWRAQALLLQGRGRDALLALNSVMIFDARYRAQAAEQVRRLEGLLKK